MAEMEIQDRLEIEEPSTPPQLSKKRRLFFAAAIYLVFLLILVLIELGTRLLFAPVNSLDLFVATPQQKMQVADQKQATIFEGDPLLLWRLKPNLNHVVWDFTVLSTNAQHFRSDYPTVAKAAGTTRIVCVGDSVTFGYRVPVVWPERPDDYDPDWLPFPMLLEKQLRAANSGHSIEVIAMAVPGYTSHQGLAWLHRDIDRLKPDLLVISFGWNDVSFSDAADREAIRTNWYAVTVRWLIDHSQAFAHATRWLRSGQAANDQPRRPVPRVSEQEYVTNIREMVSLGRSRKIGAVVIGAPYRDSITNPAEAKLMTHYRDLLRSEMSNDHVPFLDIPELTETAYPANEGWFGELIHPNHMGHRLMASELLKVFARDRLLGDLNNASLTP
jgi:lysophospholipase L1-like esterase